MQLVIKNTNPTKRPERFSNFLETFKNHPKGFKTSDKYQVINTGDIVNTFLSKGFEIDTVSAANVRDADKVGYQRHLIKFSHPDWVLENGLRPQIILRNSYDGSQSMRLNLGIFRLACANGLIVGETVQEFRVIHIGDSVLDQVNEAIVAIQKALPMVAKKIDVWNKIQLNSDKQLEFAQRAAQLVLPENASNVQLSDLLRVRRSADTINNLFTVFNRIQEVAVKGGLRYQVVTIENENNFPKWTIKNNRTRKVKSIDRAAELNKRLWDIAEEFAA